MDTQTQFTLMKGQLGSVFECKSVTIWEVNKVTIKSLGNNDKCIKKVDRCMYLDELDD